MEEALPLLNKLMFIVIGAWDFSPEIPVHLIGTKVPCFDKVPPPQIPIYQAPYSNFGTHAALPLLSKGDEKKIPWQDEPAKGIFERMGWDSNPRKGLTFGGFQDRCIQPLCHPSGFLQALRRAGVNTSVSSRCVQVFSAACAPFCKKNTKIAFFRR